VPLAYQSLTPRIGLVSRALSIPHDLPTTNVERQQEDSSDDDYVGGGGGCVADCRMSRRHKLTVVNFCVTNMCAGCFYSLLGPFFPTEVSASIDQSINQSLAIIENVVSQRVGLRCQLYKFRLVH